MAETHTEVPAENHRTLHLLGGSLLFILGIVAFNAAAITSVALIYTLGWLLVIAGIIGFVMSFTVSNAGGVILGIVSAILSVVLGVIVLFNPSISLATITLLLAMYFVVDGVIRIAVAFTGKVEHAGWSIIYGIIAVILGGAIWAHLPTSSLFIYGIFIGIGLIIKGVTVIATSVTPLAASHKHRYA